MSILGKNTLFYSLNCLCFSQNRYSFIPVGAMKFNTHLIYKLSFTNGSDFTRVKKERGSIIFELAP